MKKKTEKYLSEPARKVPVIIQADVVVAGGGSSGVCAAVAAARQGASTILIEKNGCLGGACTGGLVSIWHSLYSIDQSKKIIGGIIDDVINELRKRNAIYNTSDWYSSIASDKTSYVVDTEAVKLVFDELVLNAGVTVLLHTYVVGALSKEVSSIQAILIENKSGRGAIQGKVYVDCTGDGDLAYYAGVEYEKGDENQAVQPPGLCVRVGNLQPEKAEDAFRKGKVLEALLEHPMDYNNQLYTAHLWGTTGVYRKDEMMLAAARMVNTDCTDAFQLSQAEIEGRRQIDWIVRTLRNKIPGFEDMHIIDIAAEVGPRETRRFLGDYVLTEEDILSGRQFEDVIAQGTYPVDIHNPFGRGTVIKLLDGSMIEFDESGKRIRTMWTVDRSKNNAKYYRIPYGVLLPCNMHNLMVAGRCISATHKALGAIRVMVNCMQLGQAAGIGAAIASLTGTSPREVKRDKVQDGLRSLGMPI